jgi:KipI family sensor histidine kinase inhibitor
LSVASLKTVPLGDSAITIVLGAERSKSLLDRVHATAAVLAAEKVEGVLDIVPAYLGVAVFYDPIQTPYAEMAGKLLATCERVTVSSGASDKIRNHEIRVTYDGADLGEVSLSTGLSVDEIIARHSGRSYTVDLLGFVPGFAYLSELDPALQLPRRSQPRPRVPAGSVAIAGAQTAVYPLDTPGGWHLIGRTDQVMFDPSRDPPALLHAGDVVRFVAAP